MNGSTLPSGWLNSPYYIGELSRFDFFFNKKLQTYAVLLYYVDYLRKQDKFSNFCIHLFIFTKFEYYDRYKQNRKKRLNSPASPLLGLYKLFVF